MRKVTRISSKVIGIMLMTLSIVAVVTALKNQNAAIASVHQELNVAVQNYIRGLLSTNEQEMFSGTEDQLRNNLDRLLQVVGGDQKVLVGQLLYFRVHAQGMREALLPMVIAEQLGLSKDDIAEGLLPYLESDDKSVVKEASEWLAGTDRASGIEADLSRYEKILRERQGGAPMGLLRYMYDRDPRAAVVTIARVYGGPDVPEAEVAAKVKSGVKESVDYFAGRPEWWAHLYAAAMMEKEPYLRTPEMIEKLEQDADPLVREKVSELKEKLK